LVGMNTDTAPSFVDCFAQAARTPELLAEFDRLTGHHLSEVNRRSPINAMIDEATGRDREALKAFTAFVAEFVWAPLQG
jgi:hypothetical protein